MQEKEFTADEVLTALKNCGNYSGCKNCPLNGDCHGVITAMLNRLAEYERKFEDGELVSTEWHDEQVLHAEEEIKQLTEENAGLKKQVEILQETNYLTYERAVKNTAKELLTDLFYFLDNNSFWLAETGDKVHYVKLDDALEFMRKKAKKNGVEVEE